VSGAFYVFLGLATLSMITALTMATALTAEFSALVMTSEEATQFVMDNDVAVPSRWFMKGIYLSLLAYCFGVFAVSGYIPGGIFVCGTVYLGLMVRSFYDRLHTVGVARLSQKVKATWKDEDWKTEFVKKAETKGWLKKPRTWTCSATQ
jgi:hypothetical protein